MAITIFAGLESLAEVVHTTVKVRLTAELMARRSVLVGALMIWSLLTSSNEMDIDSSSEMKTLIFMKSPPAHLEALAHSRIQAYKTCKIEKSILNKQEKNWFEIGRKKLGWRIRPVYTYVIRFLYIYGGSDWIPRHPEIPRQATMSFRKGLKPETTA